MSDQKKMMEQTIKHIDETVDLFYQQKLKAALEQLDLVISSIMKAMDGLFLYRQEHSDFIFDENRLTSSLTEAMNALQEQDLVMLADVLQYDFKEYLEELAGRME